MAIKYENAIKKPGELSPRTKWLRDYYFEGVNRKWNNEYTGYTTGTPWDCQFDEMTYYIVPENHTFLSTFTCEGRLPQGMRREPGPDGDHPRRPPLRLPLQHHDVHVSHEGAAEGP